VEDYLGYGLWVAVSGDRVAGFLVSRPLGAGEGELLNLAVDPGCRRDGVGKALVRAFLAEFPGGATWRCGSLMECPRLLQVHGIS